MSALAPTVRVEASGRVHAAAKRRRPVGGGVLWIVVLAALLAGVVAVNVLVLQLNVRLDGLSGQRTELRADNAKLRAQLSSAAANARIARDAERQLGLHAADPSTTTYVRLAP
jgi:cell division protein FtsL